MIETLKILTGKERVDSQSFGYLLTEPVWTQSETVLAKVFDYCSEDVL